MLKLIGVKRFWLSVSVISLLSFSALSPAEEGQLFKDFKEVHKKHHVDQVQSIIDFVDDRDGISVGLVYRHGLNWNQAADVKRFVVAEVSKCWEKTFLTKVPAKKVEAVVNAYKSGKTQFLSKKVPELNEARTICSGKSGEFIQQRIDYIIANN